jgi:hypothetical protein
MMAITHTNSVRVSPASCFRLGSIVQEVRPDCWRMLTPVGRIEESPGEVGMHPLQAGLETLPIFQYQ